MNTDNGSPTAEQLSSKTKQRKNDLQTYVNTRRRVKKRRRIISKAGYNCVVDYDVFSYNQGSEKKINYDTERCANYRATNYIIDCFKT